MRGSIESMRQEENRGTTEVVRQYCLIGDASEKLHPRAGGKRRPRVVFAYAQESGSRDGAANLCRGFNNVVDALPVEVIRHVKHDRLAFPIAAIFVRQINPTGSPTDGDDLGGRKGLMAFQRL